MRQGIDESSEFFFHRTVQLKKDPTELVPIYSTYLGESKAVASEFLVKFKTLEYGGQIYRKDHVLVNGPSCVYSISDNGIAITNLSTVLGIIEDRSDSSRYYIITKTSSNFKISNCTSSASSAVATNNFEINAPVSGDTNCDIIQSSDPNVPYIIVVTSKDQSRTIHFQTYNKNTGEMIISSTNTVNSSYVRSGCTGYIDGNIAYIYSVFTTYSSSISPMSIDYMKIDIITGGVLSKNSVRPYPSEDVSYSSVFSYFIEGYLYLLTSYVSSNKYRSILFYLDGENIRTVTNMIVPSSGSGSVSATLSDARYYKLKNGQYAAYVWPNYAVIVKTSIALTRAYLGNGVYENSTVSTVGIRSTNPSLASCTIIKDLLTGENKFIFQGPATSGEGVYNPIGVGKYILGMYGSDIIRLYKYSNVYFSEVS